jgi:tetratricopeptide (TPR) repeat protein
VSWPNLDLDEGVVREPVLNDAHLALWLKGAQGVGYQDWERIWTVSENDLQVADGLVAAAAFARPMRQRIFGHLQTLLQRWRGGDGGDGWVLPTGDRAEPSGSKESDLILVWAESESASLDEGMVRARWPDALQIRRLGANCFLFRGVRLRPADQAEETLDDEMPAATAEHLTVVAAQNGDLRKKSAALSDLGVLSFNAGDYRRAVEQLSEALEIVRRLGDQSQECDVLGNLGMAVLASRDGLRATELFKKELALARLRGDRFAEKLALEHLAILCALGQKRADSISFYNQALSLARECGDRRHEIMLHWRLGIQYAELGRSGEAISQCESAVNLMREVGNPKAAWFADRLSKFRSDPAGNALGGADVPTSGLSDREFHDLVAEGSGSQDSSSVSATRGPGLLRMALTVTSAMAKFVGSGFKKVSKDVHQARIGICATCEHHTGVRCRVCGCFTNTKAWLPHEKCPLDKWPAMEKPKIEPNSVNPP